MTELVEIGIMGIFFLSGLALTFRFITALFAEEKQ
jgi:hypothetical protein